MGYPMTYKRVVNRNSLQGGYEYNPTLSKWQRALSMTRGDLRRLEADQRDDRHLPQYAARAGITQEQAKAVLDAFFEGDF